ncbi:MAG: flavodoxin [Spirochaetaceae bacterium]
MRHVGIVYGSSTGNTRDVSEMLKRTFGAEQADLLNVAEIDPHTLEEYDNLVFAVSTWGKGDLQDDWEEFFPQLDEVDLSRIRVAVMALGDQRNYPTKFADAMAILVDKAEERGAWVVGATSTEGYTFDASAAVRNGAFLGLVIDEDTQSNLTEPRIRDWVEQLKREFV